MRECIEEEKMAETKEESQLTVPGEETKNHQGDSDWDKTGEKV